MNAMKGRGLLLAGLFAVVVMAGGCSREGEVKKNWTEFQQALKTKNGEKAWALLAKKTRDLFEQAAEKARKDGAREEGAKPWAEFLEIPPEKVKNLTGKDVFRAHVENFPERTHSRTDTSRPNNHFRELRDATRIYEIEIKLNEADAKASVGDGQMVKLKFYVEEGEWRVAPDDKHIQWPKRNL